MSKNKNNNHHNHNNNKKNVEHVCIGVGQYIKKTHFEKIKEAVKKKQEENYRLHA